MVTGEVIVSDEIARERSVKETGKVRSFFLAVSGNNKRGLKDANNLAKRAEANCGQESLKTNLISTWPPFLQLIIEWRRLQCLRN